MIQMIQKACAACGQVMSLSQSHPEVEYCFTCTDEINSWHDANQPTEEELDAWADLWESQENR
jgi:hypothetical protein